MLVAALAMVALVVAGARAAPGTSAHAGHPMLLEGFSGVVLVAGNLLLLAGVAALVCVLVGLRIRRRRDEELDVTFDLTRGPLWLQLALVAAPLLLLVAVVALLWVPRQHHANQVELPATPTTTVRAPHAPSRGGGKASGATPELALYSAIGVLAVGVAAVGVYVISGRRGRADQRRDVQLYGAVRPEPTAPVDAEAIVDPRASVVAAWRAMERALGASGMPRRAAEAPREYLTRSRPHIGGAQAAMARLTSLFEHARFSGHGITPGMRTEAIDALRVIQARSADLDRSAEGQR